MTQNEMVLGWLKKAPIGPLEAMKELGIMRLAARIKDLRDDGHKIQTDWNYVIDRYGEERRVARYVLKELANGTSTESEAKIGKSGEGEEKPSTSLLGTWFRLYSLRID
jgi:hypothetical protein